MPDKKMEIKDFGKIGKREVKLIALENKNGVKAEILNYGGIVRSLFVPDKNKKTVDVVLGRGNIDEYLDNTYYFGALIGRNSNRIAGSEFEIDGVKYRLNNNNGRNNLHGGLKGFDTKIFGYGCFEVNGEEVLVLNYISEDMEEGFPGNLNLTVTYTLTKNNALKINYKAVSDKNTVANFTNHSYFNLGGHDSGNMHNQLLWIDSDFYTPNNEECMPTGEVLSVEGTPFDFRELKKMGRDIQSEHEQIKMFGGYDHNFVLKGQGYRKCAFMKCEETGISMEVYTDKPGIQLYTTNSNQLERECKNGAKYGVHQALCLETQFFPNAMEISHFESPVLKAGDVYDFTTEYRFLIGE